jgi:hypothetical protein
MAAALLRRYGVSATRASPSIFRSICGSTTAEASLMPQWPIHSAPSPQNTESLWTVSTSRSDDPSEAELLAAGYLLPRSRFMGVHWHVSYGSNLVAAMVHIHPISYTHSVK